MSATESLINGVGNVGKTTSAWGFQALATRPLSLFMRDRRLALVTKRFQDRPATVAGRMAQSGARGAAFGRHGRSTSGCIGHGAVT